MYLLVDTNYFNKCFCLFLNKAIAGLFPVLSVLPLGELLHLFINKLLISKATINRTENTKSTVDQMFVEST